jgi:RNA polymerase sigma-70 factor (ECF subfamily)
MIEGSSNIEGGANPLEKNIDAWFVQEVLPHQKSLMGYMCNLTRRDASEVADLVQEALTRVYSAAKNKRPKEARNFLFVTARNIFFDEARRAKVVTIETVAEYEDVNIQYDSIAPEEHVSAGQEWKMLNQALDLLSPKNKEVIMMRRVYGYSQRETASKLKMTEAAVESHIKHGILKLADVFLKIKKNTEIPFIKSRGNSNQKTGGKLQ